MPTVVAMHNSLIEHIKNRTLDNILSSKPVTQDKSREVRYSRRADFNDEVAKDFLSKTTDMDDIREKLKNQDNELFLNLFEC